MTLHTLTTRYRQIKLEQSWKHPSNFYSARSDHVGWLGEWWSSLWTLGNNDYFVRQDVPTSAILVQLLWRWPPALRLNLRPILQKKKKIMLGTLNPVFKNPLMGRPWALGVNLVVLFKSAWHRTYLRIFMFIHIDKHYVQP